MHDNSRNKSVRRIGELAKTAGVSTDTLRHYERKGVLGQPRRSTNGYREYSEGAADRVRLVRRALAVGFTLDELSSVLKVRDRGGVPCQRVRELAAEKLSGIESQLSELSTLRDELQSTLKDWDRRLARTGPDASAGLLEALASNAINHPDKPIHSSAGKRNLKKKGVKS